MAQRILEAETAEDLLNLAPDVALIEEQVKQLVEEQGELAGFTSAAKARLLLDKAVAIIVVGETERVLELVAGAREILAQHELIAENRLEIARLLDAKRKLTESQRKYLLQQGELIETAKAMILLDQLVMAFSTALEREAPDPSRQAAILEYVAREAGRITGLHDKRPDPDTGDAEAEPGDPEPVS